MVNEDAVILKEKDNFRDCLNSEMPKGTTSQGRVVPRMPGVQRNRALKD